MNRFRLRGQDARVSSVVGVIATVVYLSEITPVHSPNIQPDELVRETYTYDLRETATFQQDYSGITHNLSFSPYEDDFYKVTYYLSKPSEVSMYIWTWPYTMGPVQHVRTLFVRELRGAGYHTELWDGTDDKGAPVPTDKSYAMAQVFWEVSDNGIIITGDRPEITNVSADPNYFNPDYNPYGAKPTEYTIVSFDLSESANIECRIVNSAGVLVRTLTKANLPAGANTIIWDGKDMAGNLVKEGSYRISITAIDNNGNRSMTRSALVIVYY
jgi:flagellar hook assembly protein FlgD